MAQIIVADIEAYDAALPGVRTLRYATQAYVTGPADSPAHTCYEPRIQQPANVRRDCFQQGQTFGRTQIGYGELVLVNNDGALDGLLEYSFAGRAITIKLGTVLPNSGGVPTWTTVLAGTMEQAQFSWKQVTIRVRDRQQDLARPLQQVRYAGTNALPAGLEGVADDLKGRSKPLVFGQVFNVAPPCVNTDRRIYQVHHGSVLQSIDAVYDRGVALTAGAAYTSQAQMESTPPSAGQYRIWNDATAGCFLRLGSAPAGTVTVDATRGASAAQRTAGQLFNAILLAAGIPSGSISASDVTALDAAAAYPLGVYVPHDRDVSIIELLDQVGGSVGAYWGADVLGQFRIGRIVVPTGTAVGTLTTVEITRIDRVPSRDAGAGLPSWKVKLGYRRVYSVQADLAAGVADARKTFVASEYRRVESSDGAVLTANATSPEMEFNTLLINQADAQAEADRRLVIYKQRRDVYDVTVRVDAALAAVLDLGKVITVQLTRYGMNAGKKFLIVGLRNQMRGYQVELTLWG